MHPCPNCRRHIRDRECPFCHTSLGTPPPAPAGFVWRAGIRRGALVAGVVTASACAPAPLYGIPADVPVAVDAAYGIPPDTFADSGTDVPVTADAADDVPVAVDAAYGIPPDVGTDSAPDVLPSGDAGTD